MSELVLLAVVMFALIGIAAFAWIRHLGWMPEQFRQRQTDICLALLYLIQDFQRHRALSGAILDGRKEFKAEREATEMRLQRSLRAVVEQYVGQYKVFLQPPWRVLLGHWEALHNNWQSLDFFTSFDAHSNIVSEMIAILSSLADSFRLRLGERNVRVLSQWPAIIEQLGMLRALGLHAMSGNKEAMDSGQLKELVAVHLRLSRRLLKDVEVEAEDADKSLFLRTERALVRVEWLIDGNIARYHPYTFYEEMTGVIDDWYSSTRRRVRENPRRRGRLERSGDAHLPAH